MPRYKGPLGNFLKEQHRLKDEKARAVMAAATLRSMRTNVLALVEDSPVFSPVERQRTAESIEQCQCIAQLQRWFRNVYRLRNEREESLQLAYAEGTCTFISALNR
ncbi:hypothetical protein [Solirubrum puertoriconensis]|nr:hypothetical protein [Solirubrum puertoriconensis]